MLNIRKFLTGLGLIPVASTGIDTKGEMEVLSTGGKLNYHNGTTASPVVTESHSSTLTNKTIDADGTGNSITNIENADIKAAAAIDATKIADGTVSSTEFQYINTLSSNAQTQLTTNATAISDHVADATDAHAGSAITNTPSGNLAATTVQGALNELQTDVDTRATSTALTDHINDATDAHAGTAITNTPAGNLAATTVQGALNELQTDVDTRATSAALTAHDADTTSVHGIADTSVLVTLAGTQALTNKDFQGATASNSSRITLPSATKATLDGLTRKEATIVYATDTDKAYIDDGTTLQQIGTGSGSTNFITANDGTAIGAWVTYADAAATSPVNGTGGSPASTFAISTDSTLVGTSNFLWTKSAADRQGEGFSYDFSIDAAYKAKPLTISAMYLISSGTFADNDMSIWIYDVTNAVLIQPSAYQIKNTGVASEIRCEFQSSSNSTSYRLIFHTASTSASAYTLRFDAFSVSPNTFTSGALVTDWVAYTPTFTGFGTATGVSFWYKRVGDTLYVKGNFSSGTSTGVEARISFPTGLVASDTTKVTTLELAGIMERTASSTTYFKNTMLREPSVSYFTVGQQSSTTYGYAKQLANAFVSSGQAMSIEATCPIAGWGTSQILSSETDTRLVAARAHASSTISITSSLATMVYNTTDSDTHSAYSTSTGKYTVQVPGKYKVSASLVFGTSSGSTNSVGHTYNIVIRKNSTDVAYSLGRYDVANVIQSYRNLGITDTVDCIAGDTLEIRASQEGTNPQIVSDSTQNIFRVERISGPAQIAASESVNGRYYAATATITGSFSTVSYTTKDFDSHLAYSSGTLTIPAPGKYQFNAGLFHAFTGAINNAAELAIFKNGIQINSGLQVAGGSQTNIAASVGDVVSCIAGDLITVKTLNNGTSPTVAASNFRNYFSWARVGN